MGDDIVFKKNQIYYCQKSTMIKAWQLTRKNFKRGIPKFISKNKNIELWCCESSIGGQICYGPLEAPNTSNEEAIIPINEGTWIVQTTSGAFDIISDGAFKMIYCKAIKEDE